MAVLAPENVLRDEPEFAQPRMIVSGRGGHGWRPQFAAQKMISIVRNGRPPGRGYRAESIARTRSAIRAPLVPGGKKPAKRPSASRTYVKDVWSIEY
jgi:hypothetical protein